MDIDTRKQWSNYWRQGRLTSLPCGFSANYDGEFLAFWRSQFALLGPGDRVLDVCSGNGAIALLAQVYAESNNLALDITAADAADIDASVVIDRNPDIARHIRGITFLANMPVERIPETVDPVDLVTSQYGIEYTDWEQSARKIFTLLKAGGFFSFVCHTTDSTIISRMERIQQDYGGLAGLGLFSREAECPQTEGGRKSFINLLDDTLDKAYVMFNADRRSPVLSHVGAEMEKIRRDISSDFNTGFQRFTRFRQEFDISYATSTDLLAVNRRLAASPNWFEVFRDSGMELLQSGDIHYHTGEGAGKYYQFRKPV